MTAFNVNFSLMMDAPLWAKRLLNSHLIIIIIL